MRLLKTVLQKSNPLAAWWHSVLQPTKMHKVVQNHRNQWMLPFKNRTLFHGDIFHDIIILAHFWMILDDLLWSNSGILANSGLVIVKPGLCPCGNSRWSSLRAWPSRGPRGVWSMATVASTMASQRWHDRGHCHVLGQIQWGVSGVSSLSGASEGWRFRAAWWHLKKGLPQISPDIILISPWNLWNVWNVVRLGRNMFFFLLQGLVNWTMQLKSCASSVFFFSMLLFYCSRFWFEVGSWSTSWLSSMMRYYQFYH